MVQLRRAQLRGRNLMGEVAIRAENLGKRFRLGIGAPGADTLRETLVKLFRSNAAERQEIWALRGLDLEVDAGEVLGIVGPNGAGKTTLLRILARITYPTEGTARTRGVAESSCARTSRTSYVWLRGEFLEWLDGEVQGIGDVRVPAVVGRARHRLRWQRMLAPGLQIIDRLRDMIPDGSLDRLSAHLPGSGNTVVRGPYLAARRVWRRWWL